MQRHPLARRLAFLALIAGLTAFSLSSPAGAQDERGRKGEDGVEVLTRGPIHEAFAKPVVFDPKPGLTIPKGPPAPIEELPPDQKPEGENVKWISGYWSWDAERKDFIWISGIWRDVPPGYQWAPGYWAKTDEGTQWVSGFWSPVKASSTGVTPVAPTEYLPVPPANLEIGPSSEAPSEDYTWAPGTWIYYGDRYVWRPGYWVEAQPGWTYTPAQYSWTPSGCIFVDGYWDYSFRRRGVLFAPVYLDPYVYSRPYYYYPSVVVDCDIVTDHFFAWPRYHHYCFGDYYASSYLSFGIYPWFSFHSSRYGYCPIYSYYNWHYHHWNRHHGHHHHHHRWDDQCRDRYRHLRDNPGERPRHSHREQLAHANTRPERERENALLTKPLTDVASRKDSPVRFEQINDARRQEASKGAKEQRDFRDQRGKLETAAAAKAPAGQAKEAKPLKLDLPKSPLAGKPVDPADRNRAFPAAPSAPKPQANRDHTPRLGAADRAEPRSQPVPVKPDARPHPVDRLPSRAGETAKPQAPRVEAPRSEAPRPQPRVEMPEPARRAEPPRVEVPRAQPRVEAPRSQPSPAPRVAPRSEPPRVQPRSAPPPRVQPRSGPSRGSQLRASPPRAQPRSAPSRSSRDRDRR